MALRLVLVLLGLATGGLLTIGLYSFFGSSPKPAPAVAVAPPPPTMVVVAAKAIPTGTLIGPQDLRLAPIAPARLTAADFVRPVVSPANQGAEDSRLYAEILGSVSRTRFEVGDPLLRGAVVKPGDAGFLAAVLQPNMRAVTISVSVVTGAAGLIYPGDHVDVVLTQVFNGHEADPGDRTVAEIIATDLRVVAVDRQLQVAKAARMTAHSESKPAQTVTLEVTTHQVEQIEVANKMGELALVIRGIASPSETLADNKAAPVTDHGEAPVWARDLSPAAAGVHPAQPRPKDKAPQEAERRHEVIIYRGEKMQNVMLP